MTTEFTPTLTVTFNSIDELSDFLFTNTDRFYFTTINNLDGELIAFKIKYKHSPELKWTTVTPSSVFVMNEVHKWELMQN